MPSNKPQEARKAGAQEVHKTQASLEAECRGEKIFKNYENAVAVLPRKESANVIYG